MKTIPLDPVFSNGVFLEQNPTSQLYIIKAIYLLAKDRKLTLPLPGNLRSYFHCSNAHWHRFKEVFKQTLIEIIPEILFIKQPIEYRRQKQLLGRYKKKALIREKINQNTTFSDESVTHTQINPVLSPKKNYREGSFDHVIAAKAVAANATGEQKLFTDD